MSNIDLASVMNNLSKSQVSSLNNNNNNNNHNRDDYRYELSRSNGQINNYQPISFYDRNTDYVNINISDFKKRSFLALNEQKLLKQNSSDHLNSQLSHLELDRNTRIFNNNNNNNNNYPIQNDYAGNSAYGYHIKVAANQISQRGNWPQVSSQSFNSLSSPSSTSSSSNSTSSPPLTEHPQQQIFKSPNELYYNNTNTSAIDDSNKRPYIDSIQNQQNNNLKRPKSTFPFGKCKVCNDKATGVHYGIATCEGCKGFFKRSTLRKEKYRCFFGNNCPLTPDNRNRCKSCRFRKCLEVGMSIQGVKMGRIPKAEKEKAIQTLSQNKQVMEKGPQNEAYSIEPKDNEKLNKSNESDSDEYLSDNSDENFGSQTNLRSEDSSHINKDLDSFVFKKPEISGKFSESCNAFIPRNSFYGNSAYVDNNRSEFIKNNSNYEQSNMAIPQAHSSFNPTDLSNKLLSNLSISSTKEKIEETNQDCESNKRKTSSQTSLDSSNSEEINDTNEIEVSENNDRNSIDLQNTGEQRSNQLAIISKTKRDGENFNYYRREDYSLLNSEIEQKNLSRLFTISDLLSVHTPFRPSSIIANRYHSNFSTNPQIDDSFYIISSLLSDKAYQVYVENNQKVAILYERAIGLINSGVKDYDGHDATIQDVWDGLLESIPTCVKCLIAMTKELPGLNELSPKDFTTVVNNRLFDYFIIKHAPLFINEESFMMLPNNIQYTRSWMTNIIGREMVEAMFDFANEFNRLHFTGKEVAIMFPLVLTTPEDHFEDLQTIKNLNEYYYRALLYEFDLNKRSKDFLNRWKNLLAKLPYLKELQAKKSELLRLKVIKIEKKIY